MSARRDAPLLVKKTYDTVCKLLLEHGQNGVSPALKIIRETLQKVAQHEVLPQDLAITRAMTKDIAQYTSKAHLPHVEVVRKRKSRGENITSNERIQFIISQGSLSTKKAEWERAEDMVYAIEHNIEYDAAYYIRQFESPLYTLLGLVPQGQAWLKKIFDWAYIQAQLKKSKQATLVSFFQK